MDIFDEKEKVRGKLQKLQVEKNYYLGEFKENVIIAIKKCDLSGKANREIFKFMERRDAILLKINRQISFKDIKEYIQYAEKIGLSYRLVDGISFSSEIGMVLVSKETLDNNTKNVILESKEEEYIEKGLSPLYAKYEGKKICKKHFSLLQEKFFENIENFSKIKIIDRLFGVKCPICKEEGEKNNEHRSL
ncbi:DUF1694 domain-containing protein [Fusobacterium sp. MFO224]|uniref:DUF1694 domain-containing protein n=1 Tax=Fusobacterium sp. MFO224 TaxID=3378070 RepID=UPI003854314E